MMEFATTGTLLWIAVGAVLVALPALMLRHFGPWLPRLVAALTVVVVVGAIFDPLRIKQDLILPDVLLIQTDPKAPLPVPASLGAAEGAEVNGTPIQVSVVQGSGLSLALTQARLLAALSTDPVALAVVWNGPFDGAALAAEHAAEANQPMDLKALVDPDPAPLDPGTLALSAVRGFAARRPAAFEFRLPAGNGQVLTAVARLTVRDPTGAQVLDQTTSTSSRQTWRVDWTPLSEGQHQVRLTVEVEGFSYVGQAAFLVQAAPNVLVVGAGEVWSRALEVQGFRVQTAASLSADLTLIDVVLLAAPVVEADQPRLQEFVTDGGGLLVFGGVAGGAIPGAGESLAALLPVVRLPVELAKEPGPAQGPPVPGPVPDELDPAPEPKPPEVDPPDLAARGKTDGAELTEGPPVEVERRNVAVVLLVDVSTSMGIKLGREDARIEYAKKSAYETAAALSVGDKVGFVVFGDGAREVLGLTDATERALIRDRIERVRANQDRTLVEEALRLSGSMLARSDAAVRQIILITDGEFADTHPLSGSRLPIFSHARELREAGITISMIMLSDAIQADAMEVARQLTSRGAFVVSRSGGQVPRLVTAEVVRGLEKAGRKPQQTPEADPDPSQVAKEVPPPDPKPEPPEPPEQPPEPEPKLTPPTPAKPLVVRAITESPLLEPVPDQAIGYPTLDGIVPVVARTEAHTLLVAGEQGVPLLSFGLFRTGRVAVFTSDVFGPMGARFGAEPDFPARLARWISALLPPRTEVQQPVLTGFECLPVAPTPAEHAALVQLTGANVLHSRDYHRPPASFRSRAEGSARELALPALASLLLLAFAEWWRARR